MLVISLGYIWYKMTRFQLIIDYRSPTTCVKYILHFHLTLIAFSHVDLLHGSVKYFDIEVIIVGKMCGIGFLTPEN